MPRTRFTACFRARRPSFFWRRQRRPRGRWPCCTGRFIALLGVVGGYLTPALVEVGEPSAPALFAFLAALNGAAAWVARYRGWRDVAFLALAGAAAWPALWLATAWSPGDAPAIGLYLVFSLFLALYFSPRASGERGGQVAPAEALPWTAVASFTPLVFALVRVDGYGPASLATLAAVCLLCLDAARRRSGYDDLFGVAALALVLALAAVFHIGSVTDAAGNALGVDGWRYDLGRRFVAPALEPFLAFSAGFAALFAGFGYWSLRRAQRPWLWAALSAAAPPACSRSPSGASAASRAISHGPLSPSASRAIGALAAERVARRRERPGMDGALAAYAVGASAALGLAMALALQQAWLTVALSLQVAALAAIHDRLPLPGLRLAALATAAVVIVRLAFNLHVFGYAEGAAAGFGWTLYGCGLPALAFGWAARRFRGAPARLARPRPGGRRPRLRRAAGGAAVPGMGGAGFGFRRTRRADRGLARRRLGPLPRRIGRPGEYRLAASRRRSRSRSSSRRKSCSRPAVAADRRRRTTAPQPPAARLRRSGGGGVRLHARRRRTRRPPGEAHCRRFGRPPSSSSG